MTPAPATLTRRFVGLTALRWLPPGLAIPGMVLLAASRGLSAAEIGLIFAAHGAVVTVLELPTGGLADALGRRAVLAAGGLLQGAGLLTFAVADGLAVSCLAWAVVGVGRALDSGPLEAWYVDTLAAVDPDADTTPGLSRAGVADGAALSVGAVVGGLLPLLEWGSLVLPLVVAGLLSVVHVAAVLALVTSPPGSAPRRTLGAALRTGVADVPRTVAGGLRLAAADPALRALLALSLGTGFVLCTLELLTPLRLAELTGGAAAGAGVYGVVVAVSFAAAALGSGLAPRIRDLAGGSSAAAMAVLTGLAALALAGMAAGPTVLLTATGVVAFYLLNGSTWPLAQRVLHQRVPAVVRATMVSAGSLALQLGGLLGNVVQPRVAEAVAMPAAFLLAATVLVGMCGLGLALRAALRRPPGADEPVRRRAPEPAPAAAPPPPAPAPRPR